LGPHPIFYAAAVYAGGMERKAMGFIALGLLVAGVTGTLMAMAGGDSLWWGGVTLRSGAVLGSLWLVMPKARDVPIAVWVGIGILAGFLAIRPRLILFGIAAAFVAMVVVAMAQRRAGSSG
jgi:hypothetical protein